MAKGRRKNSGSTEKTARESDCSGGPERTSLPPSLESLEEELCDSEALEAELDEDSPLAVAQEIIYQAFGADAEQRLKLAREALAACPDCADAYVILGEHTEDLEEAGELFAQGVAAGRRALGEKAFQQHEGEFWGIRETRPYMRASMGLAEFLLSTGRPEEASGHLREMLRLNPTDDQGARWSLARCLLALARDDELERLLAEYREDCSTNWAYTKALLALRRAGNAPRARQLLVAAIEANRHVPGYLLGDVPVPQELPDCSTPGGKDEAVLCAVDFAPAWKATPGALAWLREQARAKPGTAGKRLPSSAPTTTSD